MRCQTNKKQLGYNHKENSRKPNSYRTVCNGSGGKAALWPEKPQVLEEKYHMESQKLFGEKGLSFVESASSCSSSLYQEPILSLAQQV